MMNMESISEEIKLKKPNSTSKQYASNTFMTPKSKPSHNPQSFTSNNSDNKHQYHSHKQNGEFPVNSIEWNNQSDYGKLMKSLSSF